MTDHPTPRIAALLEKMPPGSWMASPAHIEEGPPVIHVKEGWIIATTCSDDYATGIVAAHRLLTFVASEAAVEELARISDPITFDETLQGFSNFKERRQAALTKARVLLALLDRKAHGE